VLRQLARLMAFQLIGEVIVKVRSTRRDAD
jgi:hypothetical protein